MTTAPLGSSAQEVQDRDDHCEHDQDVNEPCGHMEGDEAEQPCDEKNDSENQEHAEYLRSLESKRDAGQRRGCTFSEAVKSALRAAGGRGFAAAPHGLSRSVTACWACLRLPDPGAVLEQFRAEGESVVFQ